MSSSLQNKCSSAEAALSDLLAPLDFENWLPFQAAELRSWLGVKKRARVPRSRWLQSRTHHFRNRVHNCHFVQDGCSVIRDQHVALGTLNLKNSRETAERRTAAAA